MLQVREALTTSALLQLPMSMGRCAKIERVNAVLEELVSTLSGQGRQKQCKLARRFASAAASDATRG